MDGLKNLQGKLGDRYERFSFNQKVLLGALLAAGMISMVIFSVWLGKEEKAVLFSNLAPEDAATALEELAKQDVQADLANGGSTVLVPERYVHRLRVDLAAKGIPSSGTVGFEIFDGQQYGMTEFLQNVNFKRALEGELTKSIESLAGIQSARVHLVLPKSSIFKSMQTQATGSVVLRLSRSARLDEGQIGGIQSLVAGSVEDLIPTNVTVIDQHGKVLSQGYENDAMGRSANQLALKKEVEEYLGSKAESMLGEVLGEGRSIVRVDATLNFEQIERERESYDPDGSVVRSEERAEVSDPSSGGAEESSVTNYEINRSVERIVGETGGVKALSVAVFVDGKYSVPDDEGEPIYAPLSDEQLDQIKRIVQTAVGLNSARGDQIEVVNMQFSERTGTEEGWEEGSPGSPGWLSLVTQYSGRLLLLVIAVVMVLSFKRNLSKLVGEAFPTRKAKSARADAAPTRQGLNLGSATSQNSMAEDVKEFAAENPEKVAEVIHGWLGDKE